MNEASLKGKCSEHRDRIAQLEELVVWFERTSDEDAFRIGVAKIAIPEQIAVIDLLKSEVENLATRLAREKAASAALTGLQRLIDRLRKALLNLDSQLGSQP